MLRLAAQASASFVKYTWIRLAASGQDPDKPALPW